MVSKLCKIRQAAGTAAVVINRFRKEMTLNCSKGKQAVRVILTLSIYLLNNKTNLVSTRRQKPA